MSGWSRRRFVEGVLAGAAASLLTRWDGADAPASGSAFRSGDAMRHLATACRKALGGPPAAAAAVLASIASPEEFARLVRDDFAAERVVLVEGVVLARTEAVVFAAHDTEAEA